MSNDDITPLASPTTTATTTMEGTNGINTPATTISNSQTHSDSEKEQEVTPDAWYKTRFPVPPPVSVPYDPQQALDDLPGVTYALEMFLASQMVESEDYCHLSDQDKYAHVFVIIGCWALC